MQDDQAAGENSPASYTITRERLRDGSHLAQLRARALPGFPIRSDEEIEASLKQALAGRPDKGDVWVFGYGSLIWNPAFEFAEKRVAMVRGWHRRFCLWLKAGRGTPELPGLMLALDRGGSCRGLAFRVDKAKVEEELLILWRREMLSGSYDARWVDAQADGKPLRVLTFVANRRHARFTNLLSDDEVAERIAVARGPLGSCAEYLLNTVHHLEALGFRDASLERIRHRVERRGRLPMAVGALGS
ncbi:cation transport protein ChaC [Rhizobiales bacterium GAS191]|nr:cation transport protein ChaC [Rhizobiales bacterium GAS191]